MVCKASLIKGMSAYQHIGIPLTAMHQDLSVNSWRWFSLIWFQVYHEASRNHTAYKCSQHGQCSVMFRSIQLALGCVIIEAFSVGQFIGTHVWTCAESFDP